MGEKITQGWETYQCSNDRMYLTAIPDPPPERRQNKSPLPDYKIKKHNRKKGK